MPKARVQIRRFTRDEIARRGHTLYQRRIRPKLAGERRGRHVAIDVKTADYEVADTPLKAAMALLARKPRAKVWLEQVGYKTGVRIGSWDDLEKDR